MNKRIYLLASLVVLTAMLISACAPATTPAEPETIVQTVVVEGTPMEVVVTATAGPTEPPPPGAKELRMNLGVGDIPTLDPSLATDSNSVQIVEETYVGLTRLDEESVEVIPGMAESWDISEDGLVYTFHLREGIPWVKFDASSGTVVEVLDCDGNPRQVTAHDFAYGILRTLNPEVASDYSYVLAFALEGAAAYNNGETEDTSTVGVRAIDDTTLELTFLQPAAYNANIAGMWIANAMPQWIIDGDECTEARGDRWTETGFNQSYGPWVMEEWVHDAYLTMVRNPFWPGIDGIPVPAIDRVHWSMLDTPPSFAEYEAGNMDVSQVPLSDIDRVKSNPVLSNEFVISPSLSTYYYGINTTAPIVDDVRVRRALSLAVDRQGLIDNVTKGGQEPAGWFCRPGLVACPTREDHPDLGVEFDPEQAREILQEYLDETGQSVDELELTLMFNTSEGNQRIAEAVVGMWQEYLGLTVELVNQEWRVFLDTIKSLDTPQIYRSGWTLDYPDANNFTREVVVPGGNDNPVDANGNPAGGLMWRNEEFNELVDQAATELDPDVRVELYAEAEEILVWEDAAIIPVYWYTAVSVTKPYVQRTYSNIGLQHIEKWDLTAE